MLVAGGYGTGSVSLSSAELYDPATGSWSVTGSLASPRGGYPAALLANGKVLVAGGEANAQGTGAFLATAELFDPITRTWSSAGSPGSHAASTRPRPCCRGGKALVVGGNGRRHRAPAAPNSTTRRRIHGRPPARSRPRASPTLRPGSLTARYSSPLDSTAAAPVAGAETARRGEPSAHIAMLVPVSLRDRPRRRRPDRSCAPLADGRASAAAFTSVTISCAVRWSVDIRPGPR